MAATEPDISATTAKEVIDVSGYLVTPGLMDIHGHFFHRGWPGAVDPDTACLPSGVTTGVDAGSTGWGNYQALKTYILDPSDTQIYAFVHLAATGLTSLTARIGEFKISLLPKSIKQFNVSRTIVAMCWGLKCGLTIEPPVRPMRCRLWKWLAKWPMPRKRK
ncbi:hypothetical protein C2W62_09485 [Candidatus Entotheonella serta]|nr:hypothetical protein C2W62_09485 [Candidatus Entotheonella serta]